MKTRVANAVERAGTIDRAHREIETAQESAAKAYTALLDIDPETAATIALAIMKLGDALKRTDRL